MKKFSLALLALAAALAIAPAALATPVTINGTVGVLGGNDSWTSTAVTLGSLTAVTADGTGNLNTFTFSNPATIVTTPITFSSPDVEVVTGTEGGQTFTFTITGPINVSLNNSQYLDISGVGLLTLTGYTSTPASFSFDSTDSSNNYGISGSSTYGFDITSPVVPEPSSLLLLGTGLFGLAIMVRRKLTA